LNETLIIIKPDAVAAGQTEAILDMVEQAGLVVVPKRIRGTLALTLVEEHYAEHRGKPFYGDLCAFMTSGPVVYAVVLGDDVVARLRTLVGATDPKQAAPGTIRHRFGTAVNRNAVHASDSPASAIREIMLFYKEADALDDLAAWTL
jgi:nucleoside-diphosphate kinase